jgi:hypothetical protein
MEAQSLAQRFSHDPEEELRTMIRMFREGRGPVFPADMHAHFEVAKKKPEEFLNHPPSLGIALGGTNTKVMIASMDKGTLVVEHTRATKIPERPVQAQEWLDGLLREDKTVRSYLENASHRSLGFSFPMSVIEGVPFHRTKVPTLDGVIAREPGPGMEGLDFRANLREYLARRGIENLPLFYQGDGIVAHHGAVALCEVDPRDKSVLLVCGTGLATGDEENYVQIGIAQILQEDDRLYPLEETEDRQLQYAVAGKGLFGLMRRAIALRAEEPGSILGRYDFGKHFAGAEDSRTVAELWKSADDAPSEEQLRAQLGVSDGEALAELQWIAARIMDRVVSSLANCTLATIVKMGPAENHRGHLVFFEGSIATDDRVLPLMKRQILDRGRHRSLYEGLGVPAPVAPRMEAELTPLRAGPGISAAQLADVDITLIGAVTSIMAQDYALARNH